MSQLVVTPSLDGYVGIDTGTSSWHNRVVGAGTHSAHVETAFLYVCKMLATWSSGIWDELFRGIFLFNTIALPDDAVISSATLQVYGTHKVDSGGIAPSLCLYGVTPASDTELADSDYGTFGTTAYSDLLTYATWTEDAWNTFTLNAAGLAAINKAGMTRFGVRDALYDVADELDPDNHDPAWDGGEVVLMYCHGRTSGGYEPKLTIDYTTAVGVSTGTGAHTSARMFQRM